MIIKSKNEQQTYIIAEKLAKYVKGGDVILLNGDLGAGKTTFVKGFAKAKGIKKNVTSPTFTLLKTYQASDYTIVHVDAYRLDGDSFVELEDYLSDEYVVFIEWSSCLTNKDILDYNLSINIKYVSKNQRIYEFIANGERYEKLLKEFSLDE